MFKNSSKKFISSVAFDVGTASVSATLFAVPREGGKPSVIKTFRRFQKTPLRQDPLTFSRSTLNAFLSVVKDIEQFAEGNLPHFFRIGLSSVFYLGKTMRFLHDKGKTSILQENEVANIINNGQDAFLKELKRSDLFVFEKVFMKALLNGYAVPDPIGKTCQKAELWVRYSAMSKELANKFEEKLFAMKSEPRVLFTSFPVTTWFLLKHTLSIDGSILMIDIGGEVTEATFIQDGVIVEVLSLPFGVFNILSRMAKEMDIDFENAAALLRGYTQGILESKAERRLKSIIRLESKNWEEVFERVWEYAMRNMITDIRMFILGGGAFVEDLKDAVTPPLLHPEIAKHLTVSQVTPDAFRDKFGLYCCLANPGDFGLVSLILDKRV